MQYTVKQMYVEAKTGGYKDIIRFMRNMKRAGLRMRYYQGRNFYRGCAVDCDNLQDVLSHTKVPCQWDNMGLGYIVYPKQSFQREN